MDIAMLYLTVLVVGAAHTFEPDHLAAVSSFVVRRPRPWRAFRYGVRWAVGHGGVILVAGTLIVAARIHVPEDAGVVLERIVGGTLIVLGAWVFVGARRLHAHRHAHADGTVHVHLHQHADGLHEADGGPGRHGPSPHDPGEAPRHDRDPREPTDTPHHEHGHAATAIGALHGLAGTAPAVALLPVATFDSSLAAFGYLLVFGVGTALSMGLYAMFAGVLAERAATRSGALGRGLARVAGVGTVTVGLVWLLG